MTTAPERPARWMDYLPLDELVGAERNPKNHHADIGASLRRFGYVEAIALDERTGRLVAGPAGCVPGGLASVYPLAMARPMNAEIRA